jgi:hypothetical protein
LRNLFGLSFLGQLQYSHFWRAHSTIERRRRAEICTALFGVSADPLGAETQQRNDHRMPLRRKRWPAAAVRQH